MVVDAVWMMSFVPLFLCQTAVALVPSLDRAICGFFAFRPVADRSVTVTVPQAGGEPVMVVDAVWMMSFVPLYHGQTAVALVPSSDRAIRAALSEPVLPLDDRLVTAPHVAFPPDIDAEALWTV
jgi:hypothetical protein